MKLASNEVMEVVQDAALKLSLPPTPDMIRDYTYIVYYESSVLDN
jgi:hypothetical protein